MELRNGVLPISARSICQKTKPKAMRILLSILKRAAVVSLKFYCKVTAYTKHIFSLRYEIYSSQHALASTLTLRLQEVPESSTFLDISALRVDNSHDCMISAG